MKRPILCSIFALIASIEIVRSNTPIEPATLLGTLNEVEIVAHKKLVKISAGKKNIMLQKIKMQNRSQ